MHLKLCKFLNKNHRFYFYLGVASREIFLSTETPFLVEFPAECFWWKFFPAEAFQHPVLKVSSREFFFLNRNPFSSGISGRMFLAEIFSAETFQ